MPSYIASGNQVTGTGTSLAPAVPSAAVDGDLLILHVVNRNSTAVISPPVGWTREASITSTAGIQELWWKFRAGETNATVTVSFGSSGWGAQIHAYRGVHSSPFDGTTSQAFSFTRRPTAPSAATTHHMALALVFFFEGDDMAISVFDSQGFALRNTWVSATGNDLGTMLLDRAVGNAGTYDFPTASTTTSEDWSATSTFLRDDGTTPPHRLHTSDIYKTFQPLFIHSTDILLIGTEHKTDARVGNPPTRVPPTYVASGTAVAATTTSITVGQPPGIQAGDLLLLHIVNRYNGIPTHTLPSGWVLRRRSVATRSNNRLTQELWWKFAGSSEDSVNVTTDLGSSGWSARIHAYRHTASQPFAVPTTTFSSNNFFSTFVQAGVGDLQEGETALALIAIDNYSSTITMSNPQDFTLRATFITTVGNDQSHALADHAVDTTGFVPYPTWQGSTGVWYGFSDALRPGAFTSTHTTDASIGFFHNTDASLLTRAALPHTADAITSELVIHSTDVHLLGIITFTGSAVFDITTNLSGAGEEGEVTPTEIVKTPTISIVRTSGGNVAHRRENLPRRIIPQ